MRRYLFSKETKLVHPWQSEFFPVWLTDKPLVLFADVNNEWSVVTKFAGVDAREEYPGSRLSKVIVELPFVVEWKDEYGLLTTYWNNYEHARLGHHFAIDAAKCDDELVGSIRYIERKLKAIGIPSISAIEMTDGERDKYSIPTVYKPINLAPLGYERDIERFIEL